MRVCYVFRDPILKGTSIEEIFLGIGKKINNTGSIKVSNFFYNSKVSLFKNIIELRKVNADVYHIPGDVHYLTPFLFGFKVINTIQDIGTYKNLKGIKKYLYGLLWIVIPYFFSNIVTSTSRFNLDDLKKYFNFTKITLINNPVSPQIQYKPKKDISTKPNVLQIGCHPHKNLEGLIKSIVGLECKLIIIGHLSKQQKNLLELSMINYVNYHGISFKKVIDCYDRSDIVVFASFHEGFGMPIVEANAIGRPIICSNVCSLPEIAGDAALFVNPYSVDEIRNSIISLINDKCMRDYYVKKGLINAEKYSQTNIADQYIDIYKKIK